MSYASAAFWGALSKGLGQFGDDLHRRGEDKESRQRQEAQDAKVDEFRRLQLAVQGIHQMDPTDPRLQSHTPGTGVGVAPQTFDGIAMGAAKPGGLVEGYTRSREPRTGFGPALMEWNPSAPGTGTSKPGPLVSAYQAAQRGGRGRIRAADTHTRAPPARVGWSSRSVAWWAPSPARW